MLEKQVYDTIREHDMLREGDHVIVGLSGGPDSLSMFHILRKLPVTLHPVHVNHKIRPGAAEEDQAFVEDLCRKEGLVCRTLVIDCNQLAKEEGVTSEEAGRNARYQAFRETAEELNASGIPMDRIKIAVAHNAGDQAETLLLRLIRGTGPDGLSGMEYCRNDECGALIIRPLLDCRREDILEYCSQNDLQPRMDHTNDEPLYARNRIRLELLPFLEQYNPNIRDALIRLAEIAAEDRSYLRGEAEKFLDSEEVTKEQEQILLPMDRLQDLPVPIRTRVYVIGLDRLGLTQDLTRKHIESIDRLLTSASPSAKVDLPHGYGAGRRYDQLSLYKVSSPGTLPEIRVTTHPTWCSVVGVPGTFADFDEEALCREHGEDAAKRICVRTRMAGDYISLRAGRKKLQDLFVDMKVPREMRDQIPVVAVGSEVLFIPTGGEGMSKARYSQKYHIGNGVKSVIHIEIIW